MKVKKSCYMRSLTALLRLSNPKNSSDSNEECEPWYITVPSITYIWTRRPQWRRRHKNRKKVKAVPVTFINSGAEEDKKRYFWETLTHQERPCSRSSTSPYETCSSRQILTESEVVRNSGSQRNRDSLMSKKKLHLANRKVVIYKTHSDSGLQNVRGTKLLGLSRSQKRLGVGTSANSQNTVGTLSSLEVNRSVQLLVCKALQSDNSIPKRRVTFSNYVSENSATDTKSQISSIIMNDNDASDTSWSRRSYVRLSDDDEDNCSMQTDLSCLISSIIFDDSKSSFFSLTSGKSSEKNKKSNSDLNSEINGTFFYVNSSYSNGSSCNLLSLSNNFSSDNFQNTQVSSLIQQNCSNASDSENKKLREKSSQSSLRFNENVPLFEIPENGTTKTVHKPTSFTVDAMKKQLEAKPKQSSSSNDIVSIFETQEEITTETMYRRNPFIDDVLKENHDKKLGLSILSNEIEPVTNKPDEMTSNTVYRFTKRADDIVGRQWRENSFERNKMITDTKIAEETETDARKNTLEDNLSLWGQSDDIIPHKPLEDITTGSSYNRTLLIVDAMKKQLDENLNPTNWMDSIFKTPQDIATQSLYIQTPRTNDLLEHKWRENFIESNQIVSDIIKAEETNNQHTYSRMSYIVDGMSKKLDENLRQSNPFNDINPVFQTSDDIPTRLKHTRIPPDDFSKNQWKENFIETNKKNDDHKKDEEAKTQNTYSRMSCIVDGMNKKLHENLRQSNPFNDFNSVLQTSDYISTRLKHTRIPPDDFAKNQWKENFIETNKKNVDPKKDEEAKSEVKYSISHSSLSNEIVRVSKKAGDIITERIYGRTRRTENIVGNQKEDNLIELNQVVPDIEIPEKTQCDPKTNSIECITIELKDISSTVKEILIGSQVESDNEDYASTPKNDISTDTSDLIVVNFIPSMDPKTQMLDNDADDGMLSIRKIFNFLQQPPEVLDASLLFKEFTNGREQPLENYESMKEIDHVGGEKSKEIVDQVELFRIDTETCGEYESVFIEMKDFCEDFEKNEILEKRSSLQFRNCSEKLCESLVGNLNGSSKHSELVKSSTAHFHNEHTKCSAGSKCCLVCGRKTMDNPRYIRPVCRVKGGTWSPHSEKDPWMNVIKKVVKYDNRMELVPHQPCMIPNNKEASKDKELTEESSKKSNTSAHQNTLNETSMDDEKKSENIVRPEEKEEECLSVIITEAEEPSLSISPVETNIPSSRTDQSTSYCPPELHSSTSFGFATFRGPRTQSAKTYFMRESVRTVQGTANRLLCVISESDSLMAVPPFLPKKPPNWFVRQMPIRRSLRR